MPSKARILVVEDEGIVAMDIQSSLERLGYESPEVTGSGEEALEKAAAYRPDLCLLDIRLGEGMDGVETALMLGDMMDVPVVYLTAYTDEQTVERVKLTQPYGYLVKPFSDRELKTTIELALHKHEMESQLREREQWLAATLRSIGDGVIVTRPDGTVQFMNPAAQSLTGWDEADAMDREIEGVLPIQAGPSPDVSSLVTRDGRRLPVADSAAPLQGFRGETAGMVMVLRDLSRRMEAVPAQPGEEEIEAKRVDAMVRMAGGVAHDFNNHLSVILGACELLAADLQDEPERLQMVEEILSACRSSAGLTKKLVAFAQRGNFGLRPLDLDAVLREGEARLREILGPGIELTLRLEPGLGAIHCDRAYLEHALHCLAQNCREAMPAGGEVVISTGREVLEEADAPRLALPLVPGPYARVDIADTGHGIPPHLRPNLFEPFFTTKNRTTGSGLGLATVHGIMNRSRGNIRVESRPGHGTTLSLYFPLG